MRKARTEANPTMSVAEASRALSIGRETIMSEMRKGNLRELGIAVRGDTGKWRYYIYKERVRRFAGIGQ